jgi:hypothetical protein
MSIRGRIAATLPLVMALIAAPVAPAQSPCTDLGGTVEAGICEVHISTAGYTVDIRVPTDHPDQRAVFDALTRERDGMADWYATYGPDGRGRPYRLDITAQSLRSGRTASLVLRVDNDAGLANQGHPDTTYTAFNYDLDAQTPITFETFFTAGAEAVLNPLVESEFGNRPGTPVRELSARTYRNFAITDDAVTFYFGQDEVIADHAGPHRLSVPRDRLAGVLA